MSCCFSNKNHVAVQEHIKSPLKESYLKNFWSKITYCFVQSQISFKIWRRNKILFLSITIFLPDFYHLAMLSQQNHSFLCKVLTNFFNYKICIWCKESTFCRKKWYISNLKKNVFISRDTWIVGIISSAVDFK